MGLNRAGKKPEADVPSGRFSLIGKFVFMAF